MRLVASYGYVNYWKVLNAKDYGVPQNRERVFLVSTLGDDLYHFPEPFLLTRTLDDVLEDEPDESYFLSREQVERIFAYMARKQWEGCGFRPNARISSFCHLRMEHPSLWAELERLSHTPNLCSYGFKYGKTLQEVEREMDLYDARLEAESRQLKLF